MRAMGRGLPRLIRVFASVDRRLTIAVLALGGLQGLLLPAFTVATGALAARLEAEDAAAGIVLLLGLLFTSIQAYEYIHAPFAFKGSIYGSTFFMATGFHGFHVIVGTIFLVVCLMRANRGDFSPRQHFGFEAAAWYWHFVDVVWLFLFVSIYVWGGAGAPVHG